MKNCAAEKSAGFQQPANEETNIGCIEQRPHSPGNLPLAIEEFDMKWETILQMRAWSPLRRVAPQAEAVLPGLWKVGEDAFLITQPYSREYKENLPEAPFVTVAVWAGSLSAVNRCFNRDTTAQPKAVAARPPAILLLGTNGTYGELLQRIPTRQQKIAERAVYSNMGEFLHKIIEIERYRFCFLKPRIAMEDTTYAVEVSLL